jgi:3-O-methylgallate 3,4-dioxygenase
MANIIAAFGSSHSPQVSSPAELWPSLAQRDRSRDKLLGRNGQWSSFDELAAYSDIAWDPADWPDQHARAQRAIAQLGEELRALEPDVVVIVGDDQHELFRDDPTPTMAIYWGEEAIDRPRTPEAEARLSEAQKAAAWAVHAEQPEPYPVASELAVHLIQAMMLEEFDVAQVGKQPAGRGIGHAFTFVRRRLMGHEAVPIVPVMVNTYFPPNQPGPHRCLEFGRALRRGIESWDSTARVVLVASGGLSHVTVDEALDRKILDAIIAKDADALCAIPRDFFQAGTSEILNWIVVAGAAEGLSMEMVDYIAAYRSEAGTGVGMGFARWV